MAFIPPTETVVTTGNTTPDQVHVNRRQLTGTVNTILVDGGAGSSITVATERTTTLTSLVSLTTASNKGQYADASGGAFAVTLPSAASSTDKIFVIKKTDSSGNAVTVTRAGSDTIDGATTVVLSAQYDWVMLQSDGGTDWRIVSKTIPSSGIAPVNAQYLTLTADATLTVERIFTPGNNITATDGGAGAAYTVQSFVHALATTDTTLSSTSVTVQLASADTGTVTYTLPDILTSTTNDKVFIFKKIDATVQTIVIDASGSQTIDGATTYTLSSQYDYVIIAADTTSGSKEWRIVGRNYGVGSFAPTNGTYVTMSSNSTLTNERVLTAGANVFLTDGGANSTVTVDTGTISSVTGDTTLTSTSNEFIAVDATGGNVTITLPAASTTPKRFHVKKTDVTANTVTVTRAGSDTIDGETTKVITYQYETYGFHAAGSNAWWIF